MFNNYLVLGKLIREYAEELHGYSLYEVFSQEKNQLVLSFGKYDDKESKGFHLIVNVHPVKPYLYKREIFNRARKNSVSFFNDYFPSPVVSIEIANYERIIRLSFQNFSLFIVFRGPLSNVILIAEGKEPLFFKGEKNNIFQQLIADLENASFSKDLQVLNIPENTTIEGLRKTVPFFKGEIIQEILHRRVNINSETINNLTSEILSTSLSVFRNSNRQEVFLIPTCFTYLRHGNIEYEEKIFGSANEAVRYYLTNISKLTSYSILYRRIEKEMIIQLQQLSDKLNRQQNRLSTPSREEEYLKLGNLLLINLDKIKKGDSTVVVEDVYENNLPINVSLKPTLEPRKNAEYYFEKAKSEKISIAKTQNLYRNNLNRYNLLRELQTKLERSTKFEELVELKKELGMEEKELTTEESELTKKFRHYILADKYHVYVGKDSAANDLLTLRFAKPNDLWFHARGYAGSHTVLRVENTKEGVPKDVIKKAASIAAFYSKGKTSKLVPVSYTFKKYVSKRKGLEVGQVMLTREQVVMVPPLLPTLPEEDLSN